MCRLEASPLHLQGAFNVGESSKGYGGSAFPEPSLLIDAPEVGGQLTSLSLFLLTPFLGDSASLRIWRVCRHLAVFCLYSGSGSTLLILASWPGAALSWEMQGVGVQLGRAGVCAGSASVFLPGSVWSSVSTPETYSWRGARSIEPGRGALWKLRVGVVTGIPQLALSRQI